MVTKVKQIPPAALKHQEAARYLGVSPTRLDHLRQQGLVEGFLHEPERLRDGERLHWSYPPKKSRSTGSSSIKPRPCSGQLTTRTITFFVR